MKKTVEKDEVIDKKTWKQDAGIEALAAQIVKQAMYDYTEAIRDDDPSAVLVLQRFFRSDWCHMLCDLDGEVLIEAAEKKGKELKKKREKRRNGQCKTSKPLLRQD